MSESNLEVTAASVFIEIPLLLSSESGRPKHIDPNEQGAWLAMHLWNCIKDEEFEGAALTELRFWGTSIPGDGQPVKVFKR
ncbi:MAG TPA: hypothetical protein VMW30_05775 [Candidatus Paceibacterota bacterium]|nr:hypothetical protein [Candidatus Paceibacterota bacterium]